MFKAILIENTDGYQAQLADLHDEQLPAGDVTVRVSYSTLNYKDGLAISGKSPVVRQFPMIPGIDLAGTVASSPRTDCGAVVQATRRWTPAESCGWRQKPWWYSDVWRGWRVPLVVSPVR